MNFSLFSISFIVLLLNDIDFVSYTDDDTLYKACENVNAFAKTL